MPGTRPGMTTKATRGKCDYDNCRAAHVCELHVMQLRENTSPEMAHSVAKNVVAPCDLFSEN